MGEGAFHKRSCWRMWGRSETMKLVPAVVTDSRADYWRDGRIIYRNGDIAWGKQEVEVGGIEQSGLAPSAGCTVDATTLSAMVPALKDVERHATVVVVAVGSICVWLPEMFGKQNSQMLVDAVWDLAQ